MNIKIIAMAFLALGSVGNALAAPVTLTFDDLMFNSKVGEQYASKGVHFGPGDFGVMQGLANGDSGNWGVDGTNGAYFQGFNGMPSYSMVVTFDAPLTSLSLDASRTNGSSSGDTLTVEAFLGASLVSSKTITFDEINVWSTVNLGGGSFNKLVFHGEGSDFHPYGVDNIVLNPVPEPETYAMLLAGLGIMGGVARRRKQG